MKSLRRVIEDRKLEQKEQREKIKKLWQPEKDTKYQRPLMSRLQFLKEYGAARINEYELYKQNMEELK